MPQHIPAQFIGRIKVMTSLPVGSRLWNKKKKSEFHILLSSIFRFKKTSLTCLYLKVVLFDNIFDRNN